jgi:peptidoglycan/LPS O-acetylase OafA/YrhL
MKYIKGLDTLRAFAVTLVVYSHYVERSDIHSLRGTIEQFLLPKGQFGVYLFFVLSGFLITSILLKAKQESDNGLLIVKNFIIRRALRIFPVYYLFIFGLLLLNYRFIPGELPYLLTYTSNIFMFNSNHWGSLAHTWSLAVEEQFYLIWPWLIIFLHNRFTKHIIFTFILIGLLSIYIVAQWNPYNPSQTNLTMTTSAFDSFGIGALYAYLLHNGFNKKRLSVMLSIAFCLGLAVSLYWKLAPFMGYEARFIYFNRSVNSVLSLALIHFVVNNQSFFLKRYLFESNWLTSIGKVSYGIYLYHWLPKNIMPDLFIPKNKYPGLNFLWNPDILFVIKFGITFIIAYLSFMLIEKRFLKLKDLFSYTAGKAPIPIGR